MTSLVPFAVDTRDAWGRRQEPWGSQGGTALAACLVHFDSSACHCQSTHLGPSPIAPPCTIC